MRQLLFSLLPILLTIMPAACTIQGPESPCKEVRIVFDTDSPLTKSSLFSPTIESQSSGAIVAFYDAQTGILDSQHRVSSIDSPLLLSLPLKKFNVYVLANLWLVDGTGTIAEMPFPVQESEIPQMEYKIGGLDYGKGLRSETFAEINRYGIPMYSIKKGFNPQNQPLLRLEMQRLFAKIELTIDHSGISNADGAFRNLSLKLKQANGRLAPFAERGSVALSTEDVLAESDFESPMEDGPLKRYVLYVPENRMGDLLAGNTDPSLKSRSSLLIHAPSAADRATYIEFSAHLDKEEAGFGGGVQYRFYLGGNNVSNFDVLRNSQYFIKLDFRLSSLFEPDWKISLGEDFSDDRCFCLTMDQAGNSPLDRVVAVRKNRPARLFVYLNKQGVMGNNELRGKPMVEAPYQSSGLSDIAWSADFSALAQYGLSASYSLSDAALMLTVTDPSRFVPGAEIPIILSLHPGGINTSMKVLLLENQGLDLDDSEFYMGMKRRASLRGFVSDNLFLSANQRVFRTCLDQAQEMIGTSPVALDSKEVDLYAYAFSQTSPVRLEFSSADSFNDDPISRNLSVYKASLKPVNKTLRLYIDGTDSPSDFSYLDRYGEAIAKTSFDAVLYSQLLAPQASYSSPYAPKYLALEDENFYINYLGTSGGGDKLVDLINLGGTNNANTTCLGRAELKPKSSLYSEKSLYRFEIFCPCYKTPFPSSVTSDYYNTYGDEEFCVAAEYYTYGNRNLSFAAHVLGQSLESQRIVIVPISEDIVRVELRSQDRTDLALAPIGIVKISSSFSNLRVNQGIIGHESSTNMTVSHNVSIGQFAWFVQGSAQMVVYITHPKGAWQLKKHKESQGTSSGTEPSWDKIGFIYLYNNYLYWTANKTAAGSTIQSTVSGSDNMVFLKYWDIIPDADMTNAYFTASNISQAASVTWLKSLNIRDNGAIVYPPIPYNYVGNLYVNLSIGTSKWGYVLTN